MIETDGQAPVGIINDGSDRVIDVAFTAGATTPLRRYTHSDNIDEPLQLETFDAAGAFDARYSYHADHLGSVRFLTDALGTVVNAYDYDSYGQEVVAMEGVEQPFRFTGREWDEAAKLYHYRARAYDPSTGVFIQEDPIWFEAGDLNVQRYVWNNPLTYTDPTGLAAAGEYAGGTARTGAKAGPGAYRAGKTLDCLFTAIGAAVDIAGSPSLGDITVVADVGIACTAKGKPKPGKGPKKNRDTKCPNRCFAAGTLVHTIEGLRPIEDIELGDLVKSMDTATGEIGFKPVTATHINERDPVGKLILLDETDGSETQLLTTADHPFYHNVLGWTHASRLKAGDKLKEDDGGTLTVLSSVFSEDAPINMTYNFEVADFHTYFVGEDGVLVHNGKPTPGPINPSDLNKQPGYPRYDAPGGNGQDGPHIHVSKKCAFRPDGSFKHGNFKDYMKITNRRTRDLLDRVIGFNTPKR